MRLGAQPPNLAPDSTTPEAWIPPPMPPSGTDSSDDIESDIARYDSLNARQQAPARDKAMAILGSMFSSKPFHVTKEVADSIGRRLFSETRDRLRNTPGVLACYSHDSLTYDGLHFLFTVELKSYRDLPKLRRTDTSAATLGGRAFFSDSIYVEEQADSVMVMLGGFKGFDKGLSKDFPMMNGFDRFLKKTSYTNQGLREGLTTIAFRKPKHKRVPKARVEADSGSVNDDEDGESGSGSGSDTMSGITSMLSGLFSTIFNFEISAQSPGMLSASPGSSIDSLTHTALWTLDLTSMIKAKATGEAAPEQMYYFWFKKPK